MPLLKLIRIAAWGAIGLVALAAGLIAFGWRPATLDASKLPLSASIGGAFSLTSQDGRRITQRDLLGRPSAVFFGFTNCPDVCPTTLLEMTNRLAELGPDGDKLRVVFITVDPEQDTPEHLKRYIANFDSRILALTGTAQEIADVARKYRAVYAKVPTKTGYTMDHTATVYLMSAKGELVSTLAYQESAETQRAKLKRLVTAP